MFGLGFGELLVILLIALIFIGPKKLPELAKGLGQGLREFQKATKGFSEQLDQAKKEIADAASVEDHTPKELPPTETHQGTNSEDKTKSV